ncbi:MAG: helix-turn-helix transcriptional regulator [Clostridiales bacterium]|nr:helix-turn-helix transcriptional regulator [Clostridiales bacterium]
MHKFHAYGISVYNADSTVEKLLANSTLTIGGIAERCGFENIYYFSNSFKKYTNISHIQYRKTLGYR